MAIQDLYGDQQGGIGHLLSLPAVRAGIGALTGGVGGAALGLMSGTPAGGAAGAYELGSKIFGAPDTPMSDQLTMPEIGDSYIQAMKRRSMGTL